MLDPPDGVAVDTDVGAIAKLRRSPVFDLVSRFTIYFVFVL